MKSKYFVIALLTTLGFLTAVVASTSAATFINNLTAGGASPNSPVNLNPGWLFWVQSDTVSGDAICVEVHPQGDAGNYVRAQCSYDNVNGPINSNWRCEVFTGGVPSTFQSKTIEYQFHTADYGTNCQTNTYLFTGFNWTFTTGPTAVSLQSFTAHHPTPTLLILAALLALGLVGGTAVSRRKTSRKV
ncbi:MAG: hypothetical protein KBE23_12935 [Chloroflexi bacterium]|nr:hypothetical protein [Chloroflexota bacterium]MBP7043644.1 hypothetical protein [Chloroflexota bacterium]